MATDGSEDLWLFGYGSLIWKPPPYFDRREPGYIEDYARRFWQASEDHRGTPERPGRVVTLVARKVWQENSTGFESSGDIFPGRVYGVAYRIPKQKVPEVRDYLDLREVNGYTIDHVPFLFSFPRVKTETKVSNCLVYIGLPSNPQFIGGPPPPSVADIAKHIVTCKGPSGENWEYVLNLRKSLKDIVPQGDTDKHIEDVASHVENLMNL